MRPVSGGQRLAYAALMVAVVIVAARLLSGRTFSVANLAFAAGVLAVLSAAGIAHGLWAAQQTERWRKAKLDIWLKH